MCTINKTIDLKVDQPGQTAVFVCPESTNDLTGAKVFTGKDCQTPNDLENVLPGAKLTVVTSTKTYTLSVPKLPATPETVCYKCAYKRPTNLDTNLLPDCVVKVTVSAAASTTSTTTSTTSSGSVASFSWLAVALLFVGAIGMC